MKKILLALIVLIASCNLISKENSNEVDKVQFDLSNMALGLSEEKLKDIFKNRMFLAQDSVSWHFITKRYDGTLRFVTYIDYGIEEIDKSTKNPVFNQENYSEELELYIDRIKIDHLDKNEIEDIFKKTNNLFEIKSKENKIRYLRELKILVLAYSYNQLMVIDDLKTKD